MKTTLLTDLTVRKVCEGFMYNELEGKGLFGMNGRLTIQPEYQRNYLYAENNGNDEIAVIESVLKGYPLGLIYFNKVADNQWEVLDGQQRITSLGRFITRKFAVSIDGMEQYFDYMAENLKEKILNTQLLVYECEGEESEIKEWFKVINKNGIELNQQEILNAVYSGTFVTRAKAEFSNSQNANINKWSAYVRGNVKRQDYLHTALSWVARGEKNISAYMSLHRNDTNINELQLYFSDVIAWIESVFPDVYSQMCGLPWGELYERFHSQPYNPQEVAKRVQELMNDLFINNQRGIFEYVLGGCKDTRLLDVRVFPKDIKQKVYNQQTAIAREQGISNCPLCAVSGNAGVRSRIYKQTEMEADHATAWSKGGATDISNCQMLCQTHNRAKGNK